MQPNRSALLVVDDDLTSRLLLRRFLTPHGFDITEAEDAAGALGELTRQQFDLVLLDVEMPDRNGLEVLRELRQTRSPVELPVMMATVKDSTSDIVEALRDGANDYVTKPFDLPVVLARAQTQRALKQALDRARQLECALSQRNAELEQANDELQRTNRQMRLELAAAAEVQETLLPTTVPRVPGMTFAWHYRPCTELAGDLLGLIGLPDNKVCLYVLDVVNHGVKAALLAVMINRVLSRLLAEGGPNVSPTHIACQLNREFPWDNRTEQYFTLMFGVLDCSTKVFHFVSAGHPGPVLQTHTGARVLRYPGLPIGLGDGDYDEHQLQLQSGDRLFLFTDGLTEALDLQNHAFGERRCAALLSEMRDLPLGESVSKLACRVEDWCLPAAPHDDITIAAVEI